MKIGIDGMLLSGSFSGVERYILNLGAALAESDEGLDITVFVPRGFRHPLLKKSKATCRKAVISGRIRTLRIFWEQFWMPFKLMSYRFDLMHFPGYIHPPVMGLPTVLTVHDLISVIAPELCKRSNVHYYSRFLKQSITRATRVIVPSERVKNEIWEIYKKPKAAIDVIPMGTDPLLWHGDFSSVRDTFKLGTDPYLLYVGNLEPKKGLPILVKAFMAAVMHKNIPHKLVIAGKPAWRSRSLHRLVAEFGEKLAERVVFTGYVKDAQLGPLYREADLFVFPSILEGFGIPPLEAMAAGVPVLLSKEPSLLETYKGAAHFFAIGDIKDLRETIEVLVSDPAVKGRYTAAGKQLAAKLTWEACARSTAETYAQAVRDFGQQ